MKIKSFHGLALGWAILGLTALLGGCELVSPKNDTPEPTPQPTTVAVTGITVTGTASVVVNATTSLTATVAPANATIKTVTWSSATPSVATVSPTGVVTGVAAGTSVITATSTADASKKGTLTVTVTAVPPLGASAPTVLFSDSGLTFAVNPVGGNGTGEKGQINGWSGGSDSIADTSGTGPATIGFGGHAGGWSGAVALVQKPSNYTGDYDFTNVASIKFKIKSATISPTKLTLAAQSVSAGDKTALLSTLVSDITNWTQVTVDVAALFGATGKTDVKTALAFFWGSSAGDTTSLTVGDSYQIGDIQFVDNAGANVAFYSGIALPPPAANPSTVPAAPTLAAGSVVSFFNSSATYTDATFSAWSEGWASAAIVDDTTSVTGKTLKKVAFVGDKFTGSTLASTVDITGKTTLHLDYWTPDGTAFEFRIVDFGANGAYGGGDDVEIGVSPATVATGAWTSVDLDFSALPTVAHIAQMLIKSTGATETLYFDNIYFH